MRILELTLLIISTILPFYISSNASQKNKNTSFGISIGILIVHFVLEGYRWQMIPVYLIFLVLAWCIYKKSSFFKGGWLRKTMTGIPLILLLVIAWALPYLLPVFDLPTPTGKHNVGSQYIHLKTNQDEIITTDPNDKRELMIKVWYPAQLKNEETEPYLNDGDRVGFASKYGLPKSTLNYLNHVETHTFVNPSVEEGQFPVLIFSPGIYANASGYYAMLEEIVSHGYIVFNINHTYETTGTLFPDGAIKLYNSEYDRKHNNQKMGEMAWIATQNFNKAKNDEEQFAAIENLIHDYIAANITIRWSKDISMVIDELTKWNSSGFLAKHLDVSKIGCSGIHKEAQQSDKPY